MTGWRLLQSVVALGVLLGSGLRPALADEDAAPERRLVLGFATGLANQTGSFSGATGTSGKTRASSHTWELAVTAGLTLHPQVMLLATAGVNLPFGSTLVGTLGMRQLGVVARGYPWRRRGWYGSLEADYVEERWQDGSLDTPSIDQHEHFNGLRALVAAGWPGTLPSPSRDDTGPEPTSPRLPDEPPHRGLHFDARLRAGPCALWSARPGSVWLLDLGLFAGLLWY